EALAGEAWALNNAYEVFSPKVIQRMTRIYEMHQPHKRVKEMGKDGKSHFWHLDQSGRRGHRIIMHQPHPNIVNSEAYPLHEMESKTGLRMWSGTGCYMIAQAILERFTEIRVYGFDQKDWEHTRQREAFTGWLTFALGLGIVVSGRPAFVARHKRRYGYDYGPEWDHQCNVEACEGLPVFMVPKKPTPSMRGQLSGTGAQ
ncbi:unnamed protein product, partial [marine sediment metagenome]